MSIFDKRKLTENYMDEVKKQTDPYAYFCQNEKTRRGELSGDTDLPFSPVTDLKSLITGASRPDKEYVLVKTEGVSYELLELAGQINEGNGGDIVYWDEDRVFESKRHAPFFKPDWSPDTLLNCNYIGESFLITTDLAIRVIAEFEGNVSRSDDASETGEAVDKLTEAELRYDFLLRACELTEKIKHIPMILEHIPDDRQDEDEIYSEYTWQNQSHKYISIRNSALKRRSFGFSYEKVFERKNNSVINNNVINNIVIKPEDSSLSLSVIIPSKDNSDILINCLESIKRCYIPSDEKKLEVIIVDNGSDSVHGVKIEDYLREFYNEIPVKYIYEKMDFNYSVMCNTGAKKAENDCLLFLNDDTELADDNTFERMYAYAMLDHVGAVGAKLYYPGGNIIQHTGVTVDLDCGPTHKLATFADDKPYYYGRNVFNLNVLAVTGACLMVSREKYFKYGCFDDKMGVGYNDTDLCVRLYENGLKNVVLNECILFHHESLSRGTDHLDDEKYTRLKNERNLLYEKHSWVLESGDPFYSVNLIPDDLDYRVNVMADYDIRSSRSGTVDDPSMSSRVISLIKSDDGSLKRDKKGNIIHKGNKRLHFNIERTGMFRGIMKDDEDYLLIEGWATLTRHDNALYDTFLALVGEDGECRIFETFRKNREDVAVVFVNERNLFLTGFVCKIPVSLADRDKAYRLALIKRSGLTGRKYIKLGDSYEPSRGYNESGE